MSDEIIIITPSTEDIIVNSSQGGAVGPAGPAGPSGVVSITAPITNTGTSTAAIIGINQTGLTLTKSQITGTAVTLADSKSVSNSMIADFAVTDIKIGTSSVTADKIGAGAVTDTKIQSGGLSASSITGTAYTVTRKKIDDSALVSSLDIFPRSAVLGGRNISNGVIYYVVFTPAEDFTMTNFTVFCTVGGTDTGGTTVRRMGLYTATGTNNLTMTLVARTASDATLGNTSSTIYTRALNTTGGYPSTYSLTAGTTYAFAMMAYNTGGTFGQPTFAGVSDQFPYLTPYRILSNSGQTDLPATITAQAVGTASAVFSRLT